MYNIKKIRIKNFLSFRTEQEFDFSNIPYLLLGDNRDRDNQESNGSGKSSFIESIYFCLTGETLRKVNNSKILHLYTEDNTGFVEIYLENDFKETLFIKRNIFKSKSFSVELFFKNTKISKTSVNEYNDYIEELIGLKKEDLLNYFILSKERSVNFTQISDTRKKEIISRFSNINLLDGIEDILIKENTNLEKKISEINLLIERTKGKIEGLKENFKKVNKENFENEKKEKLKIIQEKLENYILKNGELYENLSDEINQINESIKNIKQVRTKQNEKEIIEIEKNKRLIVKDLNDKNKKLILIEEKINLKNEEIDSIKKSIVSENIKIEEFVSLVKNINSEKNELDLLNNNIENSIKKIITCPKCLNNFLISDKSFDLEKSKKTLEINKGKILELDNEIKNLNDEKISFEKNIDVLKKEIINLSNGLKNFENEKRGLKDEIEKIKDFIDDSDSKVRKIKSILDNFVYQVEGANEKIKIIEERRADIREENKNEILRVEAECISISEERIDFSKLEEENNNSIQKYQNEIDEKGLKIEDYLNNIKQNTNSTEIFKKFKNYLSNKSLILIENKVNSFFEKINSDISIKIKETKEVNKNTKDVIDIVIIRDEIERNYNEFSSGEKAQINLGFIFCMQEIINESTENGLNFLFLDEILDSLDTLGVKSIMDSIKIMNKCILVVSHNKGGTFDNSIILKMENGETTISN